MKTSLRITALSLTLVLLALSMTSCFGMIGSCVDSIKNLIGGGDGGNGDGGNGNVGEYTSEETYGSPETAITSYLDEQISGEATDARLVSYETKSSLSKKEIENLNLSGLNASDVESGEVIIATYYDAMNDIKEYTAELYLLKVNGSYTYVTLAPKTGDVMTAAFFEGMKKQLTNYRSEGTSRTNTSMTMNIGGSVSTTDTTSDATSHSEACEDMLFGSSETDGVTTNYYYLNLEHPDGSNPALGMYMDIEGEWKNYGESLAPILGTNITCIDDLMNYGGPDAISEEIKFDHTYFIKTDRGYTSNDEKMEFMMKKICEYTMSKLGGMLGSSYTWSDEAMKIDYIVENGQITDMIMDYSLTLSASMSGVSVEISTDLHSEQHNYDFGMVTFDPNTLPGDLLARIAQDGYILAD